MLQWPDMTRIELSASLIAPTWTHTAILRRMDKKAIVMDYRSAECGDVGVCTVGLPYSM